MTDSGSAIIFFVGIFVGMCLVTIAYVTKRFNDRVDELEDSLAEAEEVIDMLAVYCGKDNLTLRPTREQVGLSQKTTAAPQTPSDPTRRPSGGDQNDSEAHNGIEEEFSKAIEHVGKNPKFAGFFGVPTKN